MLFVANQGMTVLHLAAGGSHLDCLKLLVEHYGFDVNQPSKPAGWRPLHLCCSSQTDHQTAHQCLKYLMSVGADPSLSVNNVLFNICLSFVTAI